MPIDLNGFAVLQAISGNADTFAAVRADVNKAARSIIVKQMKAKATDLDGLRRLRKCIGTDAFGLVVDGLTDTEVKSILGRLDKRNSGLKSADAGQRRQHLGALASGEAEPADGPKPVKPAASTGQQTKPAPERLRSEVIDVFRKAKDKERDRDRAKGKEKEKSKAKGGRK